jgi:hypothetical protein
MANSIKVGVSHSTFVLVKAVKLGFLMAGSSEMVGISLNLTNKFSIKLFQPFNEEKKSVCTGCSYVDQMCMYM